MRIALRLAVTVGLLVSSAAPAAAQLDLGHPTAAQITNSNISNSSGGDRSVVFDALTSFSLTSAGIRIDPLSVSTGVIRANLYSMSGAGLGTLGPLLATGTLAFTDVGLGFYDVPLAFNLVGGQRYVLGFQSESPTSWGNPGVYNMTFFQFDNSGGNLANSYTVDGTIRVVDGGASLDGGFGNSVMPHVRINGASTVVPEPGTWALLGTGLLAVGGISARRRRVS